MLSTPGRGLGPFSPPVDNNDFIGGNYVSALNFEAMLPNLLPNSTNADVSLFLDFANVWGVDYSDVLDDSDKIRSSTSCKVSFPKNSSPSIRKLGAPKAPCSTAKFVFSINLFLIF